MTTTILARAGAVLFFLWGVLHIAGGGMILAALGESPDAAFAFYQQSDADFPPLAGAILGYLSFSFLWIGLSVCAASAFLNWRNAAAGLALCTGLAGFTELGLIVFLAAPGYVTWPEASMGIALFLLAATAGGLACRRSHGVSRAAF
jgi:hypothetical protein